MWVVHTSELQTWNTRRKKRISSVKVTDEIRNGGTKQTTRNWSSSQWAPVRHQKVFVVTTWKFFFLCWFHVYAHVKLHCKRNEENNMRLTTQNTGYAFWLALTYSLSLNVKFCFPFNPHTKAFLLSADVFLETRGNLLRYTCAKYTHVVMDRDVH